LVLIAVMAGQALAQPFPDRPVHVVVPYGAGGTVDILARLVGEKLSKALGQPVVIENKPGANGIVGAGVVARAPKDGHTLLMISLNHVVNPSLYREMPFDAVRDFAGVSLVGSSVIVLAVGDKVRARSVTELIELAKRRPGQLNYSSTGAGSPTHLNAELLKIGASIDILHVPYSGAGPALNALLSGEVDLSFLIMSQALPYSKDGRVRMLAVVGPQRSAFAPEVPTFSESGIAGLEGESWTGLVAPSGVPQEIVQRLSREVHKALDATDVRDRIHAQGIRIRKSSPEELDSLMRADGEKWGKLVRALGLKAH
jgi:tripartite-type tricarboxylate transporter receptor subunit TctC